MLLKVLYFASFLVSLFLFYRLVKDDIKLLSLKITENMIFDMFLLASLFSIFGGRLVYIVSHLGSFPLTFLSFILIPYYPGFSLVGAITLGFGFLYLFLKKKNIMRLRIFDLATLSILPIFPVGFLGEFFLQKNYIYLLEAVIFTAIFIFLIKIYKDPLTFSKVNFQGGIMAIFLASYSSLEILSTLAIRRAWLTPELILAMIIFTFSSFLLARGFVKGYI